MVRGCSESSADRLHRPRPAYWPAYRPAAARVPACCGPRAGLLRRDCLVRSVERRQMPARLPAFTAAGGTHVTLSAPWKRCWGMPPAAAPAPVLQRSCTEVQGRTPEAPPDFSDAPPDFSDAPPDFSEAPPDFGNRNSRSGTAAAGARPRQRAARRGARASRRSRRICPRLYIVHVLCYILFRQRSVLGYIVCPVLYAAICPLLYIV